MNTPDVARLTDHELMAGCRPPGWLDKAGLVAKILGWPVLCVVGLVWPIHLTFVHGGAYLFFLPFHVAGALIVAAVWVAAMNWLRDAVTGPFNRELRRRYGLFDLAEELEESATAEGAALSVWLHVIGRPHGKRHFLRLRLLTDGRLLVQAATAEDPSRIDWARASEPTQVARVLRSTLLPGYQPEFLCHLTEREGSRQIDLASPVIDGLPARLLVVRHETGEQLWISANLTDTADLFQDEDQEQQAAWELIHDVWDFAQQQIPDNAGPD